MVEKDQKHDFVLDDNLGLIWGLYQDESQNK